MIARLAARVARVAAPAGLRRALCAPPAPPVLMETPARSTRKARIREHGMMGLTTAFIEQASKRGADASFRVQNCRTSARARVRAPLRRSDWWARIRDAGCHYTSPGTVAAITASRAIS
jgi:hypothetical protein